MQKILSALKDIPGVVGSFVLNESGALVSREMPAIYPENVYGEIGRRLLSVDEAITSQVSAFNDLLLKFEGHWFLCRRTAHCFLGILTTETVNYPALKMATNVALRQIGDNVSALSPVETKSEGGGENGSRTPAPASRVRRFFRGTEVV